MDKDEKKQINAKVDQVFRRIIINVVIVGVGLYLLWHSFQR